MDSESGSAGNKTRSSHSLGVLSDVLLPFSILKSCLVRIKAEAQRHLVVGLGQLSSDSSVKVVWTRRGVCQSCSVSC